MSLFTDLLSQQRLAPVQRYLDHRELTSTKNPGLWAVWEDDDTNIALINGDHHTALLSANPGLKLSLATIAGKVDVSGYCTTSQLQNLIDTYPGQVECFNHSWSHHALNDSAVFPDEGSLEAEFEKSIAWFKQRGWTYDILTYPGGSNNEMVRKVARKYFRNGIIAGIVDANLDCNIPPFNQYQLVSISLAGDTSHPTLAQVTAKIDAALAVSPNNCFFIFITHSQNFNADTPALIQGVYDYLVGKRFNVGTLSEALDFFGNVNDIGDGLNRKDFGITAANGIHHARSVGLDPRLYQYTFYSKPTDFPSSTMTVTNISSTGTAFPHSGDGKLITIRNSNDQNDFQLFFPKNYPAEIWKRSAETNGLEWDGYFKPLTPLADTTANRPAYNFAGMQYFDTDLGLPIFVKTAGVIERDTVKITKGATSAGNIRLTLGGSNYDIAVEAGWSIKQVEEAIRRTSFSAFGIWPGTDAIWLTLDTTAIDGVLTATAVSSSTVSYNFKVGDYVKVVGGNGGIVKITSVNGVGTVTGVELINGGSGYTTAVAATTTPLSRIDAVTLSRYTSGTSGALSFTDIDSTGVTASCTRNATGAATVWVKADGTTVA